MEIAIGILSIIINFLTIYIIFFQLQLRNINCQLRKRVEEKTRQPITLELINRELNYLAGNINKCIKAEENLSLKSFSEERQFKELISNISHDLRTPLTAIKGYQQLLYGTNLSDEQREKLNLHKSM